LLPLFLVSDDSSSFHFLDNVAGPLGRQTHLIRLVCTLRAAKTIHFRFVASRLLPKVLMRCFHSSRGVLSACSLALLASFVAPAALAREVSVTHTNWVDRPITNVIEVRIPKNIFISEYHTNWVSEFKTNIISVCETNLVTAYRTNFEILNRTNWETVQVFKTNWIRRSVTNVAKIDAPLASPPVATSVKSSQVASPAVASSAQSSPPASTPFTSSVKSAPAASTPVASSAKSAPVALPAVASSLKSAPAQQSVAVSPDGLVVETARPPVKIGAAQWEVQLRVRSGKNTASPVVQRWRVEDLDAGVLNFKQGQLLTLELTPGRYQIEAMVQRKAPAPVQALRTLIVVTPDAALLQPSPGKNLASAD
jgi:hypothetical protein